MGDAAFKSQLTEAHQAFSEGRFRDAEAVLLKLPQDNPKVKHNLVAVQYVLGELDVDRAMALLEAGLYEGEPAGPIQLQYEGHETALYNLATLAARTGHPHKAITILRSLLEMGKKVDVGVLGKSVCLFHTLTTPSLGKRPRNDADAALEDSATKCILSDTVEEHQEAKQSALRTFSFISDSSALVDAIKEVADPVEKAMCLNNLGALSLTEKKPYVATLCFNRAQEAISAETPKHYMLHPVIYNAGLCALLREEFEQAIESFLSRRPLAQLQRAAREAEREDYAKRQATYSEWLHRGHMYENCEFLLLPNAVLTHGPAQEALFKGSAPGSVAPEMEQLAATALQNALFLLVPPGHTYASARSAFPHKETLISYALLYWTCLELHRRNYSAVEVVGQSLLDLYDRQPPPANLHATLLCYLVEALVHLNDPEKAMKILRRCQASSLITGSTSADQTDVAQRSRVEILLLHVAITQILSGAWTQASSTMDILIGKIFDSAPAGSTEFQPEADALFAYQLVAIFLELAQGKQAEAAALLSKVHWSI
eukprot:gene6704-4801_t